LRLSNLESRRLRPPTWKVGEVFHVEVLPPTLTGNGGKSLCHHSRSPPPLATHHHKSPTSNTNPHRTTTTVHLEPAPMAMAIAIIRRRLSPPLPTASFHPVLAAPPSTSSNLSKGAEGTISVSAWAAATSWWWLFLFTSSSRSCCLWI